MGALLNPVPSTVYPNRTENRRWRRSTQIPSHHLVSGMKLSTVNCRLSTVDSQAARIPPSTGMTAPVIHDDASESRKSTMAEMSRG